MNKKAKGQKAFGFFVKKLKKLKKLQDLGKIEF